jgi:hypothetical protein
MDEGETWREEGKRKGRFYNKPEHGQTCHANPNQIHALLPSKKPRVYFQDQHELEAEEGEIEK